LFSEEVADAPQSQHDCWVTRIFVHEWRANSIQMVGAVLKFLGVTSCIWMAQENPVHIERWENFVNW